LVGLQSYDSSGSRKSAPFDPKRIGARSHRKGRQKIPLNRDYFSSPFFEAEKMSSFLTVTV
jgi:hypothetical protein